MSQIMVREWVLSASLIMGVFMIGVFVWNVLNRILANGFGWRFYQSDWNRAIIAMLTYKVGVILRVGWVWLLLREFEAGRQPATSLSEFWWVDVIGGILTLVGGLCVIREFAPADASWVWKLAAMLTVVWVVVVHLR